MKPVSVVRENECVMSETLNMEGVLCPNYPERKKQLVVFQRDDFVFCDMFVRLVNGEVVFISFEAEENLQVAFVDVSQLEDFVLKAPIDRTLRHIAHSTSRERVYLAHLPVAIKCAVVRCLQLA